MLSKQLIAQARLSLNSSDWELRYAALEIICLAGCQEDIARVQQLLRTEKSLVVRALALNTLAKMLAFEASDNIRENLFFNDASDHYGALEVRETAKRALLFLQSSRSTAIDQDTTSRVGNI